MVMPPEVPLLYRIVLAILGFLFFHMKLIFVLSRSVKNCVGILMELENTNLSEVTQTPKYEYGMYSLIALNKGHRGYSS